MPDSFMRAQAKKLFNSDLPPLGQYAVSNVFFPHGNNQALVDCKSLLERNIKDRGLNLIGWRPVPVDNSMLGRDPLDSEPVTEQLFVTNPNGKFSKREFEQELLRIRKMSEDEATTMLGPESGFYINSLTWSHITYKGQLTPEQVSQYFLDLQDPTFVSHMALVHSRFSTNTFPSWDVAAAPVRAQCIQEPRFH